MIQHFSPFLLLAVLLAYVALLAGVGLWAERRARAGRDVTNKGWVYALSLTVYCTSWTFFGSVGSAANQGMLYSAIYLGPTLVMLLAWIVVRRMIRLRQRYQFTSVVDLITQRYGQSMRMGAFITVVLLCAMVPYLGLQVRALLESFTLLTGLRHGTETIWIGHFADEAMVVMIGVLTGVFGLRRVDIRQRQHGLLAVLVVEAVVKIGAFVAIGIFVTWGLFDGFGDLLARLADDPALHQRFVDAPATAGTYLTWMTYLVLSMAAILFLPRMFHVMVVENGDERHLATAMWMFPLYLLGISFFVLPIAAGGLLLGFPKESADWLVIRLPLEFGGPALTLLAYLGGFSAAVGMIMVVCTTMAIMFSNHIVLPLTHRGVARSLQGYLRPVRWAVVFALLGAAYLFERGLANSYLLIQMGLISFAAVLQFVPAGLGGLFWQRGSRVGAWWGLSLGWFFWAYTLLLPAAVRSGLGDVAWLATGPWGMEFLQPEALFGLDLNSPYFNAAFWSLLFNGAGYVLGSLLRPQDGDEIVVAREYADALGQDGRLGGSEVGEVRIDLARVRGQIESLFARYLSEEEAKDAVRQALEDVDVDYGGTLSGPAYLELSRRVERTLAGSVGAAMARRAVGEALSLTEHESAALQSTWTSQLAALKITPQQLRAQVDYFRTLQSMSQEHAAAMEEKIVALEQAAQERDHADAARRESETRFRALADGVPVMIWMSGDIDGNDYSNRAWSEFTGMSLQDQAGGGWMQGIHDDDRARVAEDVESAIEHSLNARIEFQYRRADGAYRDLRAQFMPRISDDGLYIGLVGTAVDISDLMEAERTLRRGRDELEFMVRERTHALERSLTETRDREQTIRAITDSAQDAVIMLDGDGRVSFWNPAAERIFGWPSAEVMQRPLDEFLLPERFRQAHRDGYARFQQGGGGKVLGHTVELLALNREGHELPVELSLSSATIDGQKRAIGMLCDITERKQAQTDLQNSYEDLKALNHKLEEAQNQLLQSEKMASIGQLAAGVAHEINNPVGFVNSNLNTLKKYSAQMLELIDAYRAAEGQISDVAQRSKIEALKQALDIEFLAEDLPALIRESEDGLVRVKKIVQDLKDFSHVDESEWQLADLNSGLDSTLNVVWNEVKYKAKVEKRYGALPEVECLIAQLNQVFMNLIVNAVHAIDESRGMGTITLSSGHENDWVWVEVMDTGKGMTPEVQKRVFEPFFTTKPVGKGTGLGLSLSFSIVQKHNGRIDLKSEPGVGTTFRVWVPVRHAVDHPTKQNGEGRDAGVRTGG